MLKFMRKIPAGTLLIPMLIAALLNTFVPGLFNIGGLTEALFTPKGANYVVGLVSFCSATSIDIKKIASVLKKQGVLLLVKIIVCFVFGYGYISLFGQEGIMGVSAIAFIVAICSVNPSVYLAIVSDYGDEDDKVAFGLVGLVCIPAFPMLVYSITNGGSVDWTPIISTIIPIILGMIIGNIDKDMASLFSPGLPLLMPFLGWSVGSGINLVQAVQSGFSGIVITLFYYIVLLPPIYLTETKILKFDGMSTLGMSTIAGLSAAMPMMFVSNNPELFEIATQATSQITFGVVLTSIITPSLAKWLADQKGIVKNK
ncbi:MAG: 2-keto-3-deoxygluconate permease, partial [Erysipelotrichaceae bacterium]|jgi:2-keto-3-deoxygluconate permease|nr:2-keto-3-deoxygluconate permease [Bacillota bacterium]